MLSWQDIVKSLYPNLLTHTYCVPPFYMNRVQYSRQIVGGEPVRVRQPSDSEPQSKSSASSRPSALSKSPAPAAQKPSEQAPQRMWSEEEQPLETPPKVWPNETRDDFAQQHVLQCLRTLGETDCEPMFVLSQLNFNNYLNKIDPALAQLFPKPSDMPDEYHRGDFDVLIIHRKYGALIGEIKSVGLNAADLNKPETEQDDDVARRLQKAVTQLKRSGEVLDYIVKDIVPEMRVRKTVIVPYVARDQLLRILASRPTLKENLCHSLGVDNARSAAELCLCSDDLSDRSSPWDVSHAVLTNLRTWWHRLMASSSGQDMADDQYTELIARFCGPATTVSVNCVLPPRLEVRTDGQAVAELGRRLSLLVLTPAQLDLLSRGPDAVCLTGPPGTGKSLVLVVKGLISARDSGYYVIVLSTSPFSLAVSKLIHHQLTLTLEKNDNTASLANKVELLVHDLRQDPESVEEIVKELEGRQGKLCVLMDEAIFNESPVCTASHNLVRALKRRLANRLCLWAACLSNANIPEELQVETLTESLRCAPSVCRQVEMGLARISDVDRYTSVSTPPAYGPDVIRLHHQGTEHNTEWPVDCVACGEKIAEVLKKLLQESESELQAALNAPSPLQYRDVLVLTRSADLHETTTDENNQEKTRASGVVRGLRSQDIPVGVLGWRRDDVDRWQKELDDLAVSKIDKVTVARWRAVDGLERKVVVYLPGRDTGVDGHQTLEEVDADDRLRLVSRASTQLIMVDVPRAS